MNVTAQQAKYDAAWKQLYRAMSYLVRQYGHSEDSAIQFLNGAITECRREMASCES